MKIFSWNVNGIRSIHRKGFVDILAREKPDIVCLQEIKAHATDLVPVLRDFPDYEYFHSTAKARGYSGVSLWVRKRFDAKPVLISNGLGKEVFDSEGRIVTVEAGGFTILNSYFPSGTSGEIRQAFKYKYLDAFQNYVDKLPASQRKRLIILGDFNICHREIDIHHPKEAERRQLTGFLPNERKWMDSFSKSGFVDSYRHVNGDISGKYTWWTYRANARAKNLGWRIDYAFVPEKIKSQIKDAQILHHIVGSDHCPVLLHLKPN